MSKVKIIDKKSVDNIQMEKDILSTLRSPFIVNLIYAFQDHNYLYLVMDLLNGGNLRYHLSKRRRFNEKQTKFFVACTLLGLEYIHKQKILHRDIKPENLVLDDNGYIHITDFGIAKRYTPINGKDTSGTMGYIAPEVLRGENHSYCVDFYATGIIIYECLFGHRPYLAKTKRELRELILTQQAQVEIDEIPNDWSEEAAYFINKLIQRKPKNRLGSNSIDEIKRHKWFSDFDWRGLQNNSIQAPYVPKQTDNFDKKYCGAIDRIGNDTMERYNQYLMDEEYEHKFIKFSYNIIPEEFKCSNNYSLIQQAINTGDVTTKDTTNNNSALQQKLSRNKIDKKRNKNEKKYEHSKSLTYSGGSCSMSIHSKNKNDGNKKLNDSNHCVKEQKNSKKEKYRQEVQNRIKQKSNQWNSNNQSPSKCSNILALYGPNVNSNKNINDGSISNSLAYDREHLLKPCYPGIRHKNKKISVLLRNNIGSNKKNTSFLLGINNNYSLSSSRRKSPISTSHSKENQKLLSSSNSSKHFNFKNNMNQSFLVLNKKLPLINLSFTKRKNIINQNEQDLSFGNIAPQIINYSDRRGNDKMKRNQFCSLNFYYGKNNNNLNINQKQDGGNVYNGGHNNLMNKSTYNMGSNSFQGKIKMISKSSKNNRSVNVINNI